MAVDQTEVAMNIAATTVEQAGKLVRALEILELMYDQGSLSGMNMADYDGVFLGEGQEKAPELKHVDGSTLNQLLAIVVSNLRLWLETETTVGGDTYEEIVYRTCNVIVGGGE